MPQGARQVRCLPGLRLLCPWACISTVRPLQAPAIAGCVKGAFNALIGTCTGEAKNPGPPVSLAPECRDAAPSLQMRFDGFRGIRIGEAQNPGPAFAEPGVSATDAPTCGDEFLLDVGDPKLSSLKAGDRFDVVIHFNGERYKALWHDEHCFAHNLMIASPGTYTVYGAILCSDDVPTITGDSCTRVFARPLQDGRTCWRLQELCAGLGGIAVGMQATGGCVLASVDRCVLSCETLRLNGSLVVQGDLQDRHVRIAAHEAQVGQSCLIAAGVPCQGYSPQGNCKGFDDPRSRTLLHVLRVVWHTQAYGLVLECVPAIADSCQAMQIFAKRAHMQVSQVLLELAHQWPTRRGRWWCALLPEGEPLALVTWNDASCDGIRSVIPQ